MAHRLVLPVSDVQPNLPNCEVRTERWKYIHYRGTDPVQEELFDLRADPKEMNNLSANPEYSTILNQLRARNEAYKVEYDKAAEIGL